MVDAGDSIEGTHLKIGGETFALGQSGKVELTVDHMMDQQPMSMVVHVVRGSLPGPCLLVSAGIHGNEICGIEAARRLLEKEELRHLKGDLIVVPVVNQPAYKAWSRYLPGKNDLNRLFPGSQIGPSGDRLANLFVEEVVKHCSHAVDMHSGIVNRPNLPQVRISPNDGVAMEMARAFRAPVVVESPVRDNSLRQILLEKGIPSLLYEAGEANRLDRVAVGYALRGLLSLMRELAMLPGEDGADVATPSDPVVADTTYWERAPFDGIFSPAIALGQAVEAGAVLGTVVDPFGGGEGVVKAMVNGVIIGSLREVSVEKGDALLHIAVASDPGEAECRIQESKRMIELEVSEGRGGE